MNAEKINKLYHFYVYRPLVVLGVAFVSVGAILRLPLSGSILAGSHIRNLIYPLGSLLFSTALIISYILLNKTERYIYVWKLVFGIFCFLYGFVWLFPSLKKFDTVIFIGLLFAIIYLQSKGRLRW